MPDDPSILKVFASEDVKMDDVPPGTPKKQESPELPPDEKERREKAMLEYTRLMGRYVTPHNIKSRWVKAEDLPRLVADGQDMAAMCHLPHGKYPGGVALAHPQIEDKDPLRFFVLPTGMVVINPVIINHTRVPVFKEEGCLSFPDSPEKTMVPRYQKIVVTYQSLMKKGGVDEFSLSAPHTADLSGTQAHIFQHEVSHLNGCNVYDDDFDPEKSIGLGDGEVISDLGLWEKVEEIKKEDK